MTLSFPSRSFLVLLFRNSVKWSHPALLYVIFRVMLGRCALMSYVRNCYYRILNFYLFLVYFGRRQRLRASLTLELLRLYLENFIKFVPIASLTCFLIVTGKDLVPLLSIISVSSCVISGQRIRSRKMRTYV